MQRLASILLLTAASLLTACGTTVGDPCTTKAECGGQICINREYTPGGYCSQQCTLGDDRTCPAGTTCIRDGQARDNPACFRTCSSPNDCRAGYECKAVKDNPKSVCVGPTGL